MKNAVELLNHIAKERPVGTAANDSVLNLIHNEAVQMGYDFVLLPFECNLWENGKSFVEAGNEKYVIDSSPFSKPYDGKKEMLTVHSLEELGSCDCNGKILLLEGEIAENPLMPKNFPFYYPEEHEQIINLLEEKKPEAIIAVTDKHPMCGLNPFPLFEDGNFAIPSSYLDESKAESILKNNGDNEPVHLCIESDITNGKSTQIVAIKKSRYQSRGKIIVCAHMDTKYDTPGALDNGAGVIVLLEIMNELKDYEGLYDLEFIPFNGEEYYEVKGQLEYLTYLGNTMDSIKLVINIDSPCFKNSKTAVSSYHFDDELTDLLDTQMARSENIVKGIEWYAGDHAMFAFREIPCIAVTSSNLFESALEITHTEKDTIDRLDTNLIKETANFLAELIRSVSSIE